MSKWMVANKPGPFRELGEIFHLDPVTVRLLVNRGLTNEADIIRFRDCSLRELHNPELLPDIQKAADIIASFIKNQKSIRIVGDYDVDGICSTAILMSTLSELGAVVDYRIPHRMRDGYGINISIIEEAHRDGRDLLITCDNGIAAAAECARAKEYGMQVIVTDHHEVPCDKESGAQILPPADSIVNPKVMTDGVCTYPQPGICGAVVAMKLMQVLFKRMADKGELPFSFTGDASDVMTFFETFPAVLEEATLATVCDVMNLEGENRIIVKRGLEKISDTKITGLSYLKGEAHLNADQVSVYHLGFVLGPCLNAGGRLDTGEKGVQLLLSDDRQFAEILAEELVELNDRRKQMTEDARLEAEEYITAGHMEDDKVLVIYLPEIHESIAGIVAGRIKEAHTRPTIVLTRTENGVKGSARSIEGYHMFNGLSACEDLLSRFGGHPMAAGLSLDSEDKIPLLRQRLNENCDLTEEDMVKILHLDMELPPSYLSEDLIREWDILEPLGNGNPGVLFGAKGINILSATVMGKNRNVCKMIVADPQGNRFTMILFSEIEKWRAFLVDNFGADHVEKLFGRGADIPMTVKIVYYPDINEFRGERTIQLVLQDYKI